MSERKWTSLESRLRRRLREMALSDYRDHLHVLEAKPDEVRHFIDLVATNETSFFRAPCIRGYFTGQFLPGRSEAHADTPLRGRQRLRAARGLHGGDAVRRVPQPAFRYRILDTSIGGAILCKTAAAHFQDYSIEGLKQTPDLLGKYLSTVGDGFSMGPGLRTNVHFRRKTCTSHHATLG